MKVDHSTYIIIEQQSYSIHLPLSLSLSLSCLYRLGTCSYTWKDLARAWLEWSWASLALVVLQYECVQSSEHLMHTYNLSHSDAIWLVDTFLRVSCYTPFMVVRTSTRRTLVSYGLTSGVRVILYVRMRGCRKYDQLHPSIHISSQQTLVDYAS